MKRTRKELTVEEQRKADISVLIIWTPILMSVAVISGIKLGIYHWLPISTIIAMVGAFIWGVVLGEPFGPATEERIEASREYSLIEKFRRRK